MCQEIFVEDFCDVLIVGEHHVEFAAIGGVCRQVVDAVGSVHDLNRGNPDPTIQSRMLKQVLLDPLESPVLYSASFAAGSVSDVTHRPALQVQSTAAPLHWGWLSQSQSKHAYFKGIGM